MMVASQSTNNCNLTFTWLFLHQATTTDHYYKFNANYKKIEIWCERSVDLLDSFMQAPPCVGQTQLIWLPMMTTRPDYLRSVTSTADGGYNNIGGPNFQYTDRPFNYNDF
jgi:hypothetical protein